VRARVVDPLADLIRLPIETVAQAPLGPRLAPCPRCGSRGFNLHQRISRPIKDPQVHRVEVERHRCKRCGWVGRMYPAGVGPGRQSVGQWQLSVLLLGAGLSNAVVRVILRMLGCAASADTIRANLALAERATNQRPRLGQLRMRVEGDVLAGNGSRLSFRLVGFPPGSRWLEISIEMRPGARDLLWRFEQSAQWVEDALGRIQFPPESSEISQ
jgi:hypothetical protein